MRFLRLGLATAMLAGGLMVFAPAAQPEAKADIICELWTLIFENRPPEAPEAPTPAVPCPSPIPLICDVRIYALNGNFGGLAFVKWFEGSASAVIECDIKTTLEINLTVTTDQGSRGAGSNACYSTRCDADAAATHGEWNYSCVAVGAMGDAPGHVLTADAGQCYPAP